MRGSSTTAARERWVGVAHSRAPESAAAGAEAARGALAGRAAKLLIVFCADSYDLDELLAAVNEESRGTPLIGCSTAGEIASNGPGTASAVVVALGGDGFAVTTAAGRNASSRLRDAGADAASCLRDVEPREHTVLVMLTDGLAGDQQEIVRGAYGVAGAAIPLVGGCAGDDLKMSGTFQFHGREVLRDAVVAAAVASDAPFGIGVKHGWRTVREPMLVTSSVGNRVHTIGDEPALDAYLRLLNAPPEAHTDESAFTSFALTHPLGLSRRSGEEHVRFIAGADFENRALNCIAEVPQGALVWLMEGDRDSVLAATDAACADAVAALGERPPLGVLAFDCIARRGVLGETAITEEISRVAHHANGAPVAGFYTYGEIARTRGMSGFHNQTLVVLAVG